MNMQVEKPRKMHKKLSRDLRLLIHKYMPEEASPELVLAIASQVVGQLLAMQDQRKHTAAQMVELIQANIEAGNQQFVVELMEADGQTPPYIN